MALLTAQGSKAPRSYYKLDSQSWEDFQYTNAGAGQHRIGEISVLNTSGQRYVYGIPAYNHSMSERLFSVGGAVYSNGLQPFGKLVSHSAKENTTGNESGDSHHYNATETPAYAHAFLLTEVLSTDYVDADGIAGPSTGDFGSYTKFSYAKQSGRYRSRSPIDANKANFIPGHLSNKGDDKASCTYNERDVYYLHSVETKTHIAIFELSSDDRMDAHPVTGANGGLDLSPGKGLKKLEAIHLYELEDYRRQSRHGHAFTDGTLCL